MCKYCGSINVREIAIQNHGRWQPFAHCRRCGKKTQMSVVVE
jgi:transcription elongation factor Elf1